MDNNLKPLITVLMPCYNCEKFIADSIKSILNQTYKNFIFLIINDGSTDRSLEIIKKFQQLDPRIKVLNNEKNLGLVDVRNLGIKRINTKYIAFLDSDDVSYPTRLEKQLSFLEANPDYGMIGTFVEQIDETGQKNKTKWKNSASAKEIPIILFFHNCFTQSSIMVRKSALADPTYRPGYAPTEDYDLWIRISKKWKVYNIHEILTKYRIHNANISTTKRAQQIAGIKQIHRDLLLELNIEASEEELKIHGTNGTFKGGDVLKFLDQREKWLKKIIAQNFHIRLYDSIILEKIIAALWLEGAIANAGNGWPIFFKCLSSPLIKKLPLKYCSKIIKLAIKCLLRKNNINK